MEILCTNGLKSVMTELVAGLEDQSGSKVALRIALKIALTWGSTVALVKEIAAGARGDIAMLTREAIDQLAEQGMVLAGSRIDIARSEIGIAVRRGARKPDIGSPQALRHALLAASSIAHSKTGQSGIYFPTVLERLGISEQMQGKLVVPAGGVPIGDIVASGDAEMGIQQISELMPVDGIEILGSLPEPLQKITIFSGGVLSTTQDAERARCLLELISSASRPLLAAKGLEPA